MIEYVHIYIIIQSHPSPNRSRPLTAPGNNQLVEPLDAPGPGHARYQAPQRCTMICRERLTIPRLADKVETPWSPYRLTKVSHQMHPEGILKVRIISRRGSSKSTSYAFENSTGRWLEAGSVLTSSIYIYVPTWQFPPIAWETSLKTLKTILSSHLQQASIRSTSTLCIYL